MMTLTELNTALDEYYTLNENMKSMKNRQDKLKTAIIEAMNGEPVVLTENYQVKLIPCCRMILLEEQVKQKYNIEFTDEDYRPSAYNTLRINPIKK